MKQLLFKITDVFSIKNRGVVIAPGVGKDQPAIKRGDQVELHRPDGTIVVVKVAGIEMINPPAPGRPSSILISGNISKEDIPIGTEVWTVE